MFMSLTERVVIPDVEFIDIMVSTVFSTDNISVMLYGEEYSVGSTPRRWHFAH